MRMNNKGGGQRRCWRQGRALSAAVPAAAVPALIAISTIGHLVIVNQTWSPRRAARLLTCRKNSHRLALGYFPANSLIAIGDPRLNR